MSDRDKKIILVLMIIAVVALPYVFVIKEKRIETETLKAQNIELQARLDYLNELNQQRDKFILDTETNNKERDKIIASFPADVRQENYTMFLLNTEYSSATVDEEGELVLEYPIVFSTVDFGTNVEMPIIDPETGTELNYTTIVNSSTVTYQTFYDGFKHYLSYFLDYKDPMCYPSITASVDSNTGIISGQIVLSQYAISGEERELKPVEIAPDLDELELRGNLEKGVFGYPEQIISWLEEEEPTENVDPNAPQDAVVVQ